MFPEMKALPLTAFLFAVLSSLAYANEVVIRDAEDGSIITELNIDAKDASFVHAGRRLTIERKASLMELRARQLHCPAISFRDASLEDVAFHLRHPRAVVCDEDRSLVINFVVNDQAQRELRVSITLREVSLYDALSSLAQKYGLTVDYDDHTITVTDPKPDDSSN